MEVTFSEISIRLQATQANIDPQKVDLIWWTAAWVSYLLSPFVTGDDPRIDQWWTFGHIDEDHQDADNPHEDNHLTIKWTLANDR